MSAVTEEPHNPAVALLICIAGIILAIQLADMAYGIIKHYRNKN
jgi:hypothetical protein